MNLAKRLFLKIRMGYGCFKTLLLHHRLLEKIRKIKERDFDFPYWTDQLPPENICFRSLPGPFYGLENKLQLNATNMQHNYSLRNAADVYYQVDTQRQRH